MDKIFFTSDTHFGHDFIAKHNGFYDHYEQDEILINNWNAVVNDGDRVYILGDMFWKSEDVAAILPRLKGQKFLILGNHDRIGKHNQKDYTRDLVWIKDTFMLKIKNGDNIESTKIWLSHYPHEVWPEDHYGSFHLFGHVHAKCSHKNLLEMPNRFNVGIMNTGFMPIEWNQILKHLKDNNLYKKDYRAELRASDNSNKRTL